ncbi:MAG: ABC transporter permease subunit, partial [Pseudomonadota bacterium]|nr:ABC transporter permease subunit [Pseudomonadota bacterium]
GWARGWDWFVGLSRFRDKPVKAPHKRSPFARKAMLFAGNVLLYVTIIASIAFVTWYVFTRISWHEGLRVLCLGLITGARVMILVSLCSLIWVPVGVWIGLRPQVTQYIQPLIQFLASFPAYLFYPVVVMLIVHYHLNPEIWTSPLMILGTQWYILFNVIVGTMALPKGLRQAAGSLQVRGWLWWKRVMLPGIFPYYITGAITAAGGAWNASIVAEVVTWGDTKIRATGLGAYIAEHSTNLDYPRLALGIAVMCLLVVTFNRIFWRPLYNIARERFVID